MPDASSAKPPRLRIHHIFGCHAAAQIAETTVPSRGNAQRLEIFSQEDQKNRRSSKDLGFALPPSGWSLGCAPKARRTTKPSVLLIFL
jgi:hypothetical protein